MLTRSQAVAKITDRRPYSLTCTFGGSVTSSVTYPFDSHMPFPIGGQFGTKPLSLPVSEIFNVECHANG